MTTRIMHYNASAVPALAPADDPASNPANRTGGIAACACFFFLLANMAVSLSRLAVALIVSCTMLCAVEKGSWGPWRKDEL